MLLAVTMFGVAGCGLLEKLTAIKDDFNDANGVNLEEKEKDTEMSELVVETPTLDDSVKTEEIGEIKKVLLYFSTPDGKNLVPVEKEISKVEGLGRQTVENLLEGPSLEEGLVSALPLGTNLLDINIKDDKLCIVDFSRDLIAGLSDGDGKETLAVYSIVNTLCQFDSVDRVEIRVEGKKINTLAGQIDLTEAVMANPSIVRK